MNLHRILDALLVVVQLPVLLALLLLTVLLQAH
jgi:hypothetical protein